MVIPANEKQLVEELSDDKALEPAPDGKWYCDICNSAEEQKEDLICHRILHLSSHSSSRQCPVCKKTFTSFTSLRNHLTVHTGIKKYKCKYCSRQFGWKTQLRNHENLHTGKGLHLCDVCGKPFMTKWLLQRHVKIHNKKGTRYKRKGFLDHTFQQPSNDITTKKIIGEESCNAIDLEINQKKYQCYGCEKMFSSSNELAFHLLSHNSKLAKEVENINRREVKSNADHHLLSEMNGETEKDEICVNLMLSPGNKQSLAKNSLTSIVSKLYHKVDEQHKYETQNENDKICNGISNGVEVTPKQTENDNNLQAATQKQGLSARSVDPFISGILINQYNTTNSSKLPATVIACQQEPQVTPTTGKERLSPSAQFQDQIQLITQLREELFHTKSYYEREFASLNSKIDCLTTLVSSQSIILNRMLLGGKMVVNGTVDFNVQEHN